MVGSHVAGKHVYRFHSILIYLILAYPGLYELFGLLSRTSRRFQCDEDVKLSVSDLTITEYAHFSKLFPVRWAEFSK
jgi:hypothetical protein